MKRSNVLLAVALGLSPLAMRAAINGNDVLIGIGTGAFARGSSYALKQQGEANNSKALFGAAMAAAIATVAVQSNMQGGGISKGIAQLAVGMATFVASMYIWPTIEEAPRTAAHASVAQPAVTAHHHCEGDCSHRSH